MPVPRLAGLSLATVAGVVALVGATTPAVAAPVVPTAPAPVAAVAGGGVAAADDASGVAGYAAPVPDATRHTATATFKVPKVVCPARATDPLFVSAGLFGQVSATDDTFAYATGGITVTCTEAVPFYGASVDTASGRQSGAVSPGDVLQVKFATSRTSTTVTMTDTTSGGVFRITDTGLRPNGFQVSAQGGFGSSRFPRPVAPIRWTAASLDGALFATYSPFSFDQTNAAGDTVLHTSELADRSGFTITFVRQP